MCQHEKSCLVAQMNFFKRATTSILRRPGKTVILLLLVFILGTVIAGAISVQGAIANTDANLRARMQPIVAVEFDRFAFGDWLNEHFDWDNFDENYDIHPSAMHPRMTPSHVRAIADLDYVAFDDFMIQFPLRSFDLDRYTGNHQGWHQDDVPTEFHIRGTSSTDMIQFATGVLNLFQGEQFAEMHMISSGTNSRALVSYEFAMTNNLSIGSTITLSSFAMIPQETSWGINFEPWNSDDFDHLFGSADMNLTVIGIFEVPVDEDTDEWNRLDTLNTIFVPNWTIETAVEQFIALIFAAFNASEHNMPKEIEREIEWLVEQGMELTSFFIIDDPANIDAFRELAMPLLPEFHNIVDMTNSFSDIESPMVTMQGIANVILWVSVGATLLILSLLITLFLRDRRYEMGVYLALGEKKGKIISQILLEVVATALIGISLAVFSGHLISSELSNNMLMNELQATQAPNDDHWGGMWVQDIWHEIGIPNNDMTITEMADAFQVTLGSETILLFYGVGLGAVILSTLIPVGYVVTLKPKKVLM